MKIRLKGLEATLREAAGAKFGYFFWVVVLSVLLITVLFNAAGMHFGLSHSPFLLNIIGGEKNVTRDVGWMLLPETLALIAVLMPKAAFKAGKYWPYFRVYVVIALFQTFLVALAEWQNVAQLTSIAHLGATVAVAGVLFILRISIQWIFAVTGDLMLNCEI